MEIVFKKKKVWTNKLRNSNRLNIKIKCIKTDIKKCNYLYNIIINTKQNSEFLT